MIIWINGAFGVGKTAVARELLGLLPEATLLDPGRVGANLDAVLPRSRLKEVSDPLELASWRRLLIDTINLLLGEVSGPVVVPLTLLRREDRDEIFGSLAARGARLHHVLLYDDRDTTPERSKRSHTRAGVDGQAERTALPTRWDGQRRDGHGLAREWLGADAWTLDTSGRAPRELARVLAGGLERGKGLVHIVSTPSPSSPTIAAGVLFFDDRRRVLLVDPTYKAGWEFPGGVVEPGEAPARGGVREVREELGIRLRNPPPLLVVDWEPPAGSHHGGLRFLFDGGDLSPFEMDQLLLPAAELREWRFVTEPEAAQLLTEPKAKRLRWAVWAKLQGRAVNLEQGVPVGEPSLRGPGSRRSARRERTGE
ncbi:NUDIX hydrolase [Streptomyces sp. NPDC005438]|uniref:NUDIX hydrolase n=1 Tax=Streptomyces sp. NPDC005438 TaxID=3156880 RepID=UPI0033B97457